MAEALNRTLRAAAAGDQDAWRRIVDVYSGRVYGLIYRQCHDRALAEEITQAAFVKVVRNLDHYSEEGKFQGWLFRIAMNRLRDEMRRRKRQATPMDFTDTPVEAMTGPPSREQTAAADPSAPLLEAERNAALHEAIARLPDADREILHLRYTSELSFQEIAAALDQPLGTVLARGHRALKKLKAMLEQSL
jgi:RNA polymerase sigma-70 factor (ECF subfamily)